MAYTASHGPPSLDATHQWAPAAGTAPPVLNDVNTDVQEYPRTRILNIANWRGRREIAHNSAPRTFGAGEIFYPERRLGKTLVYECVLEGDTDREAFKLEQNAILLGFDDGDEGAMTVTPWTYPGGVVWTYSAKVLDLTDSTNWELDGASQMTFVWPFTLTLRMADGLFYTGGVGYP
jgi:hypothetical protein